MNNSTRATWMAQPRFIKVNCTCILYAAPGQAPNFTDPIEQFLFFEGYQIPLEAFTHAVLPKVLKRKLGARVVPASDFERHVELPEAIFQKLHIEEKLALFMAPSASYRSILGEIIEQNILRTEQLRRNALNSKWCTEGECDAFVDETSLNGTGIHIYAVDLLQIIELGRRSLFSVSSVYAEFSIPVVQKEYCSHDCRKFYWESKRNCENDCQQRLRHDRIAVTAEMKARFQTFVRATAVSNLREKYRHFFVNH
ncbi:unnamed protein product, partial [Mesorhabditis spiculigera]